MHILCSYFVMADIGETHLKQEKDLKEMNKALHIHTHNAVEIGWVFWPLLLFAFHN